MTAPTAAPTYEIFAVKYGERVGTRGAIFIGGDPHDAPLAMDYYVWAIRNGERTVIVDTGFSRDEGERRGRIMTQSPDEGLRRVGIEPNDVQDVIISHMHYDHAGNLDLFPNARFHLQTAEMAFATGRGITFGVLGHSFTKEDALATLRATFAYRVQYYSGDAEIAPGIAVHFIGGHAAGLQCVSVQTERGRVILAADAAHYYESFLEEPSFTTHVHMSGMLEGYRTLRRLAPSDAHIVPGHDPLVLRRYPAAAPGLDGIAVRVDRPEQADA
ncbi:MAG: N-acyl homoserine lactonase family protein [Alphaproteobacteria bacterium]|nr:N-acyl homoserine lactonase family protein [Alphaproteobacteria bacterium]MCB9930503.1 N-acyl homoserine lactonase family protein [Alphaproteobacteria bacterium]